MTSRIDRTPKPSPDRDVPCPGAPPSPGASAAGPLPRRTLLLFAACVAAIHLVGVTNRWWPTPDSALYLGLARSLAAGQGYRFNGSVCTSVTPGLPLVLAGLRLLCGEGFWAPNLFIAVCGLATIVLIYLVISRLAGPAVALCVAAATALSYVFYTNAHRILTDMPFAALFWGALYAAVRYQQGRPARAGWLVLAGLLTAASAAVRAPGVLVIAPAAVGLLLDRSSAGSRKHLIAGAMVLSAAVVVAATFYLLARAAASHTPLYAGLFLRRLDIGAGERLRDLADGLAKLPATFAQVFTSQRGPVFDQLGLIAMLLALLGVARLWRRGKRLVAGLVVLYPIVLIVFAGARALRTRYLLPMQAMFVYAAIEGLCWCVGAVRRWKSGRTDPGRGREITTRPESGRRALPAAVKILVGFIIVCNAPRVLRNAFYYSYLSRTTRYYQVIRSGRYAELVELADMIRRDCPPDGRVGLIGKGLLVLHVLSERRIVPLLEVEAVTSSPHLDFVVLDKNEGDSRFRNRVAAALGRTAELKRAYRGKQYLVYRRSRTQG